MRAVIYARYSSDLQREASIEDQIEVCRRYAKAQGWTVVDSYTDAAISGASRFRPGFQKLLADAGQRKFDIVICEAIDRLGRRLADTADLKDQLTFQDIRLFTPTLGEITTIHVAVMGMMAQMALKDLGEKTKRGQLGRVLKGRIPAGIAYGYRSIKKADDDAGMREIVPEEAAIVRRVFQEYAGGKTPEAIVKDLNREGVRGPEGREWSNTTLRGQAARGTGLLNNTLYRGVLEWNRCSYIKNPKTGKRIARPNPPDQWESTEVPHLRIIDEALWERVKQKQGAIRARLAGATDDATRGASNPLNRTHRARYLLSGLLRCGCCGGDYIMLNKQSYGCSNRKRKGTCDNAVTIRREEIDARVLIGLKERLLAPELVQSFLEGYADEVKRERERQKAAHAQHEKKKTEIDRKIAGIMKAIEDGLYEPAMKERLAELKAQKVKLEHESQLADLPDISIIQHPRAAEVYRRWVEKLETTLNGDDPEEAMDLIRSLIDRVELIPRKNGPGLDATLYGALAEIMRACETISQNDKRPTEGSVGRLPPVVAGAGFEPTTFRL